MKFSMKLKPDLFTYYMLFYLFIIHASTYLSYSTQDPVSIPWWPVKTVRNADSGIRNMNPNSEH